VKESSQDNNLRKIKRNNPNALPPAGKNIYEYDNMNMYNSAKKYDSIAMPSPLQK